MIYKHSFILEIYPFYKFLHCLQYLNDIQALIYLGNFSSLFHMDNNYSVIGFYNQTMKLEIHASNCWENSSKLENNKGKHKLQENNIWEIK